MGDACLRKAELLFHFGCLVVDNEDDASQEGEGLGGHESDTPMDGGSAASLSEEDEEGEDKDEQGPSPCQRVSSGRRGDHPPVFQSNEEGEGSATSTLFQPPYPLDSRHSYYNDPSSAYK